MFSMILMHSIVALFPSTKDCQWTDLAMKIKFGIFITSFFAIGVCERGFFASSAPVIPLDSAPVFCRDAL